VSPVISQISSSFYGGFGSIEFNGNYSKALILSGYFVNWPPNSFSKGGRMFGLSFNAQTGASTENWFAELPFTPCWSVLLR
jgi:hypothetical protein